MEEDTQPWDIKHKRRTKRSRCGKANIREEDDGQLYRYVITGRERERKSPGGKVQRRYKGRHEDDSNERSSQKGYSRYPQRRGTRTAKKKIQCG